MDAQADLGADAPSFDKIRTYFNHPLFIEVVSDKVADAIAKLPETDQAAPHVVFTAHSIPMAMAETSPYVEQLTEAARLVAERHFGDFFGESRRNYRISKETAVLNGQHSFQFLQYEQCMFLQNSVKYKLIN